MSRLKSLLLLSCLVVTPGAMAGELYKCTLNGQTKYQDKPCEKGAKSSTRAVPGMGSRDPSQFTMDDLYLEMEAARKARNELEEGYRQAIARAANELGESADPEKSNALREKLRSTWLPRIQAAAEREEVLAEELRRRCPNGVSDSGGRFVCEK